MEGTQSHVKTDWMGDAEAFIVTAAEYACRSQCAKCRLLVTYGYIYI